MELRKKHAQVQNDERDRHLVKQFAKDKLMNRSNLLNLFKEPEMYEAGTSF
ncbi:MAG: hypothetical protein FGF53_04370 [Candidatus Brockarchaeota archaeon]|nr:hypothetical protein [Candidatus Brockarchaeota archaeon]MBO3809101.1 hypothetical protein [Candidatus Brockarchaeota archaeon]